MIFIIILILLFVVVCVRYYIYKKKDIVMYKRRPTKKKKNQNKNKNMKIYKPTFINNCNDCNNRNNYDIKFNLSNGNIMLDFLSTIRSFNIITIKSQNLYKNISQITATLDLTKFTNLNNISSEFYLINDNIRLDIFKTINKKIEYGYTNMNDLLYNNSYDNPNKILKIKIEFIYDTQPNILISTNYINDDDNSNDYEEIYNAREQNTNVYDIFLNMKRGYQLECTLTQLYISDNFSNKYYRYNNSQKLLGSYAIKNIKINGEMHKHIKN